jgi:hypothetical protein
MIRLDWFLKDFSSVDQLYKLWRKGMIIKSSDGNEVTDAVFKLKIAEEVLLKIEEADTEGFSFDLTQNRKVKDRFKRFLKLNKTDELYVDFTQAYEFFNKHNNLFTDKADIIFFIWHAMPEVERLYNVITSTLTISDERTDGRTWIKKAVKELKTNPEAYEYLKTEHVKDVYLFTAPDRQESRDIPGKLIQVLLKDYLNVEKVGIKRIWDIYKKIPKSLKISGKINTKATFL